MHQLRSTNTVRRFRFVALLLCLKLVLIPTALGMMIYSLISFDHQLVWVSAGLIVFTFLISILLWFFAVDVRCPLCMTPFMARPGCSRHRRASSCLGSYRMPVAAGILFKGQFTCPYCNERTAMTVRKPRY